MPQTNAQATQRVAIFIDGANFQKATYEGLGMQVDFKALLAVLTGGGVLVRAYYYTGEFDAESIEHYVNLHNPAYPEAMRSDMRNKLARDRGFHRYLNRNGYHVVTKGVRIFRDALGDVSIKANVDLELAIDMLNLSERVDKVVLVSGDGDFVPLVRAVAARGVRVAVVSTQSRTAQSNGYRASDLLIDAADEYLSVEKLRARIERNDRYSEDELFELIGHTLFGVVEEKNADRGFGFLRTDDGKKVFFHLRDLQGPLLFENLNEEDEVLFELREERDERQPYARARDVRPREAA